MNRAAIFHTSDTVFAYPVSPHTMALRVLAARDDLHRVRARYRNVYEHTAPMDTADLTKILSDGVHDVFEGRVRVEEKRFRYYFELEGDETLCLTSDGFIEDPAAVLEDNCFVFPYINEDEVPAHPAWARGQGIYQVLVDRYADGDPRNNPPGCKPWDMAPDWETYYGGDFDGLIQKLPYIQSLGLDILYLSPVFLSPTYHKYDTVDYFSVDEIYGGREGLKRLIDAAHALDMRILLDGVFNHCSDRHPYFLDVLEKGAVSPYADWFCIFSYDDRGRPVYDSFGGLVPSMPRWNTCNPAVVDYLCCAAVYWTRELQVDGWRLDVADEVPHSFWKTFRRRLRAVRPAILLIGEVWNHAAVWLQGDEFDGVTNYKYRRAMLALARNQWDSQAFWEAVQANLRLYKTTGWPYLVNLLGSHDTARLFTEVNSAANAELALLVTYCLEGIPLLYYGDEVGLTGGEDPDNRRAMPWDRHPPLLSWIRQVGELRRIRPALQDGSQIPVSAPGGLLRFLRRTQEDCVGIAANFGPDSRVLPREGGPLFSLRSRESGTQVLLEPGGLWIYQVNL